MSDKMQDGPCGDPKCSCGKPSPPQGERGATPRHIKSIRRKYLLHIEIDGHEWKDVIRELQEQCDHIEQHGEKCSSVGGGGSTGHIVDIDIDPSQTPEKFEKQLEDYMEARKARTLETEAGP